jgi:hypothetical protein
MRIPEGEVVSGPHEWPIVRPSLDEVRHACVRFFRSADVVVAACSERTGDLFGQELAERLARDAPYQLAHEVTLIDSVISARAARFPPRCLSRKRGGRSLEIADVGERRRQRPARDARGVSEQLLDSDVGLALRGELRPVLRYWRVESDPASVGEDERAERSDRFRRREPMGDRVALERSREGSVEIPAPQIDDRFAVDEDRDRSADVGADVEVLRKGVANRRELLLTQAVDFGLDLALDDAVKPGLHF